MNKTELENTDEP